MPEQGPAWEITAQREDSQIGSGGTYVMGVTVTFRTRQGHVGSVFVDRDHYTVDDVRAAVNKQAAMMDAVGSLQG